MSKKHNYILLFIATIMILISCKKDDKEVEIIDNSPLYQQLGYGKKYTTLTVNPMYDTAKVSQDFITRWNTAKESLLQGSGTNGRQLQSFQIVFINETQLTVRLSYRSNSGIAVAIYTYDYTMDEEGNISILRVAMNTNASVNVDPYVGAFVSGYLEAFAFKPDWIEDKFPESKGSIAAFYRSDDTDSYFYGTIK